MWWWVIGLAVYIAVVCTILNWFFLYFLPGEGVGPLAVHYTLVTDDKKAKNKDEGKNDEDSQ